MPTTTRRLEATLKSHWKLDSTYGSTVGADSIGSNTLNIGLCSSTTGKVNEAALFARASSQYLGIVSNANLQSLKSFAFWIKFTTISNDMSIIHKGSTATAANSSVWIKYDTGNNRIQFQVGDGAGNSATTSTSGFTFATATWYFVCCRYDTAAGKISIAVNGVVYGSAACTLTQFVETGTFYLGRDATGSYLDGALDEVCVSASSLTIGEELTLYNGGSGIQPPFLEGPIGVSSSSNRYPRRLPPSFAQHDNGNLYIAYGDEGVRKWDGLASSFTFAGVPAPTTKPKIASGGEGRIIGERYAYLRYLDADGVVSNLSPISDKHDAWGSPHSITGATNASPIVVTSVSHGLTTGELVSIQGVQGNTAANGSWYVTSVSTDTFSLLGSVGNGDYLSTTTGDVKVTTLRNGAPAVNEVQTITASGTPSGGTWTITFNGSTTSALAHDANAATVQTALRLLPSIGGANVTVSGGALGTAAFTLTFSGTLAGTDLPEVTTDDSALLGASVTVSVATLTQGSAAQNEVQTFALYGTPTGGTFTLTFNGQTTAAIAYNAANADIDTALENLSNIGAGDITIGGGPLPGTAVTVTFGNAMANTNQPEMTINGASLTGGSISVSMSTPTPGVSGLSSSNRAWWKFDETSGTRYDSVGNFDLGVSFDDPASTSGVIGNAVRFDTSGAEILSTRVSSSYPRVGSNFTGCCWYRQSNDPAVAISFATFSSTRDGNGSPGGTFTLSRTAGNRFMASVTSGAGGSGSVTATTFGAIPAATLCFVALRWNASSKTLRISINAGSSDSGSASGSFNDSTCNEGNASFENSTLGPTSLDIDEAGFWSRELSDANLTSLYNSGAGLTTPFSGGTNEVQRITVNGSPAQGSFTLTYDGQTTSAIAHNATATDVDNALEALSNIGAGDVTCSGGPLPGSVVNITFTGALAETDVSAITANDNLLKTSITTTTQGDPGTNELQRISASPTPISGTFTLTFSGQTTSALAYNATASDVDTALEALSNIGAGDLTCTGGPINSAPVVVTFGGSLASTNVAQMTATSSLLGAAVTLTEDTNTEGVPALNEQQQIFTTGTITGGTYTLTYDGQTTSSLSYLSTAADVSTALKALSNIGDSDVACSNGALPVNPITVDFQGSLAGTNLSEMTVTSTITGGGWARGAQYLTYSNLETPTDRRVVKRQILRNKFGDATTFYIDVDTTDLTSTSLTSYKTDEQLGAAVPLQDDNGFDLNVVRHGEPPNSKRAIASFLNRLFLAVSHRNTLGELSVTNASGTITGQNAFFRSVFDNRTVYPQGTSNTDSYLIDSVNVGTETVTSLTTYTGSTLNGVKYGLETAEPDDLTLYFSELDHAEWWNVLNGLTLQRNDKDGEMTGLCPLVTSMLILFEHRSYKLTFRASPLLSANPETGGDGRIIPASWRGCVNHRCAVTAGGKAYLLDDVGLYTYDDNNVEELSAPIDNMFSSGHKWSIYWPAKENFHAVYDAENATVKWFVVIGDGIYPRHAICWHVDRKRPWLEEYPWPVTSSCLGHLNGRQVVFLGSTHRRIFVSEGSLDAIDVNLYNQATLRGTVTSAGQYSLTDSTASFPSSLANVPVVIASGTGAGQKNVIVSNTATKLTLLRPWTTAPDTTSTYQIGGIIWTWKSGMMRLTERGSEDNRGVQVTFTPTTRASSVLLRKYADFSATADTFAVTHTSDGVTTTKDSNQVNLNFATSNGFVEISNDSFFAGRGTHTRYTTLELTGTTNGERQQVSEVAVIGVES